MTIECPLCGEQNVESLEALDIEMLNLAYERYFGIQNAINLKSLSFYKCQRCDLEFFHPVEIGGEALYHRLQEFDWYYMEEKHEYVIAKKYLPENGRVLEVGAGKAAFANLIGTEHYTGLEFSDKAIERASQAGVNLLKQTVEEHAAAGNLYDAVVSFQVLEHIYNPSSFIRGCVQCLKPGGVLIIAVPANDGVMGGALNDILNMPPHHITRWRRKTLCEVATLFDIELLSIEHEPIATYHTFWANKIIWENKLRGFFCMRNRVFDYRFSSRLLSKGASILASISPVSLEELYGHTVVAVFNK